MNVFVLCTGRCGSTTFKRACDPIRNYTAAHESRTQHIGAARLRYPDDHIEVDNRLSWFLGRLETAYGKDAFYVHLRRNDRDTAASFLKRYERDAGIIKAYRRQILWRHSDEAPLDHNPMAVCLDYCKTVNANIAAFLKDKPHTMNFALENAHEDFERFWDRIGAEGNLANALREWEVTYNQTEPSLADWLKRKLKGVTKRLPSIAGG